MLTQLIRTPRGNSTADAFTKPSTKWLIVVPIVPPCMYSSVRTPDTRVNDPCHAIDVDREGPKLAGVYGRRAGGVAGFTYSAGLKNSGVTWNDATLEKWLSDPDVMVPDNNMSFSVPKAEERRDLIAFLMQ
jgi:hypothetical protein